MTIQLPFTPLISKELYDHHYNHLASRSSPGELGESLEGFYFGQFHN